MVGGFNVPLQETKGAVCSRGNAVDMSVPRQVAHSNSTIAHMWCMSAIFVSFGPALFRILVSALSSLRPLKAILFIGDQTFI